MHNECADDGSLHQKEWLRIGFSLSCSWYYTPFTPHHGTIAQGISSTLSGDLTPFAFFFYGFSFESCVTFLFLSRSVLNCLVSWN